MRMIVGGGRGLVVFALATGCVAYAPSAIKVPLPHDQPGVRSYLFYEGVSPRGEGWVNIMRLRASGAGRPEVVRRLRQRCGGIVIAASTTDLVRATLKGGFCDQPPREPYAGTIVRQSLAGGPSSTIVGHVGLLWSLALTGSTVVWYDNTARSVGAAPLRGGSARVLVSAPNGLGFGPAAVRGRRVYYVTCGSRIRIGVADLSGRIVDRNLFRVRSTPIPGICPTSIAVNDGFVYWAISNDRPASTQIGRARIDGTDVDPQWIDTHTSLSGHIAANNRWLFWGWGRRHPHIGRVDLDGGGVDRRFAEGGGAIALTG